MARSGNKAKRSRGAQRGEAVREQPGLPRGLRAWLLPALLVATFVAYAPALRAPFIFDDVASIAENTSIRTLWPPWTPLFPPANTPVAGRPIANASLALNYAANVVLGVDQRPDPDGPNKTIAFHLTNVLLHLVSGWLLFGIIVRTMRSGRLETVPSGANTERWRSLAEPVAAAVTALWLLHPINTDAVDYLIQRTELLSAAFYLGALYASIRAWDAATTRSRRVWYSVAVTACVLGVGSKEVGATAPLILLLYDRAFRATNWRDTLRGDRGWFYAALAAKVALSFVLIAAGSRSESVGFDLGMPWYQYLYSQGWAIAHYVRLVVWPAGLTIDYGQRAVEGLRSIPGLVLVAALGVGTLIAWRRAKWLGFLGAWFFVILAPSSSFVPITTEIAAERRFYLPLAALLVAMMIGAEALRARRRLCTPTTAAWAVAGVSLVLATATNLRSATYTDPEALWRDAVAKVPGNARAYDNLAAVIVRADPRRAKEAETLWRQAIATDSTYLPSYPNLGSTIEREGRLAEAKVLFERALTINPDYALAEEQLGLVLLGMGDAAKAIPRLERVTRAFPTEGTLVALGTAYLDTGRPDDAAAMFKRAIAQNPERADAERFLGWVLTEQGKVAEALPYFESAARREPGSASGLAMLAVAYAESGRASDAATAAARAVAIDSSSAAVFVLAGRAMLRSQHLTEAESYFGAAATLSPSDPEPLTRLGIAKAALGKRAEAERLFQRALGLSPSYAPAVSALARLKRGA